MPRVNVTLNLPESLADEARGAGLLEPETLAAMLRQALQRRRVDRLFEISDRLGKQRCEPMTADEIEAEIRAARAARRNGHAAGA